MARYEFSFAVPSSIAGLALARIAALGVVTAAVDARATVALIDVVLTADAFVAARAEALEAELGRRAAAVFAWRSGAVVDLGAVLASETRRALAEVVVQRGQPTDAVILAGLGVARRRQSHFAE